MEILSLPLRSVFCLRDAWAQTLVGFGMMVYHESYLQRKMGRAEQLRLSSCPTHQVLISYDTPVYIFSSTRSICPSAFDAFGVMVLYHSHSREDTLNPAVFLRTTRRVILRTEIKDNLLPLKSFRDTFLPASVIPANSGALSPILNMPCAFLSSQPHATRLMPSRDQTTILLSRCA